MPISDIDLCSAALVKLGAQPITSFSGPQAEAEIANRLYPIVRDALMTSHPWCFTLAEATLVPDPSPREGEFAYAFYLPADLLRTISAGTAGRSRGLVYRVQGGRLLADVPAVVLAYQRRTEPSDFSVHFAAALVSRLAAEFCLPVTENASRAEVLHRLAAAEAQLARLLDSQQNPPRVLDDYSLLSARWS
jgi:hypothetical protein